MTIHTLTALYDRYEDAESAVSKLEAAGIPHSDISIVANNEGDRSSGRLAPTGRTVTAGDDVSTDVGTGATVGTVLGGGAGLLAGLGMLAIPGVGPVVAAGWLLATLTGAGVGAAIGAATGGLVGSLTEAGVDETDAHAYAEGVKRGGTLVTVRADETLSARAIDILEEHGLVDLDERGRDWQADGWTGSLPAATDASLTKAAATSTAPIGSGAAPTVTDAAWTPVPAVGTQNAAHRDEGHRDETIPLAEERIDIGKRAVEGGRVRVRSYAVETPVQEQVTLRNQHVEIDRHAVDRPLTGADPTLFRDRTIEATEHREVLVVSKEARVTGEIGLRKNAEERVETVSDTVRRTEVEIEDERGEITRTGTAPKAALPR